MKNTITKILILCLALAGLVASVLIYWREQVQPPKAKSGWIDATQSLKSLDPNGITKKDELKLYLHRIETYYTDSIAEVNNLKSLGQKAYDAYVSQLYLEMYSKANIKWTSKDLQVYRQEVESISAMALAGDTYSSNSPTYSKAKSLANNLQQISNQVYALAPRSFTSVADFEQRISKAKSLQGNEYVQANDQLQQALRQVPSVAVSIHYHYVRRLIEHLTNRSIDSNIRDIYDITAQEALEGFRTASYTSNDDYQNLRTYYFGI